MIKKIITIILFCIFQTESSYALSEKYPVLDIYKKLDKISATELKCMGNNYLKKGIKDTALICLTLFCNKYDPLSTNEKEKKEYVDVCNQLGTLHYNSCDYKKAMNYFIKGLSISENTGNDLMTARIYNNIGSVYLTFKEYGKAIYYFNLSYTKSKKNSYNELIYLTLNNLAIANCYLGKTETTQFYIKKISNSSYCKSGELCQSLFNNLGAVNMNAGSYDSAIYYFKKAYRKVSGADKQNCVALSNIGFAFKEAGCSDSAIYYLNLSNMKSEKHNLLNLLSLNYKQLSQIYETKGNYRQALLFNKKSQTIKDSIFDNHKYGEVKDRQFVYEMDKISKELDLLNVEKEIQQVKINSQHRILVIISISFLLILALWTIVYIQKRKLEKSYKSLFIKNVDIIHSEKHNRELRIEYEKKIEHLETKVSQLMQAGDYYQELNFVEPADNAPNCSKILHNKRYTLMRDIKNMMDNSRNYCNVDFTLETLAELVHSNTKYVSLVINSEFGKNFNSYINEYRIKEACRLLISSESKLYTIETIASMVGFKSKSSFNPIFKKITGLTPSQYQKISIDSSLKPSFLNN